MFTATGIFYYPNLTKKPFTYTFKTGFQVVDFLNTIRIASCKSWYHTDVTIKDCFSGVVIIGAI